MGIGCMRYKELAKKIPNDIEVEIEGKDGDVIIRVKKKIEKKAVDAVPSMF